MLLCVAVVAGSLVLAVRPDWRRGLGLGGRHGYTAGEQVDLPERVYGSSPFTLVVFSRSDCPACQGAKPALKDLIDALRQLSTVRVAMVAAHGEAPEEQQFGRDLGLDKSEVLQIDLDDLRLEHVPTTLLVDRHGRVHYSLEGPPTPSNREGILKVAGSAIAVR
jgi:peroxiredoxin